MSVTAVIRAWRLRGMILQSVACLALIFPHYLTNGAIFGKRLLNIKYVFRFSQQVLSKTFLIVRRTERGIINVNTSSCKVPVIFVSS